MNKRINKKWLNEILLIIVLVFVAVFFRFFHLSSLPFGFHTDEVMNGYVGRYILQNGTDIYGNPWPFLYFNNFGDYPNVVPMYLSGVFTYAFGVNEFGVRFPIALLGTLTVVLVYGIGRWLYRSTSAAFISALILAVLPWHIVLSRATAEGITGSFFLLLGFMCVFRAVEKKTGWLFALGSVTLLSTYLMYPGFRLLVPIGFLAVIGLANGRNWKILAFATTIFFFLVTGYISQTTWGKGRYDQTSVFTHNNVIKGKTLRYATGIGDGRILEARIFHNKLILAGVEILRQYGSYFSPQFLVGDAGKPARYLVPENGEAYYIVFLIVLGAVGVQFSQPFSKKEISELFKEDRVKYFVGFLWLFLISPLPAALTLEDVPNIHRSALLSVMSILCLGFLLAILFKARLKIPSNFIKIIVVAILLLETIHFWHYFTNLSAKASILYRNEEQNSLAKWLIGHHDEYVHVFVPTVGALPLHYLLFQNNFDPILASQFRSGLKIDVVDNISFIDDKCPIFQEKIDALHTFNYAVVVRAECQYPHGYEKAYTITYADGAEAYYVLQLDIDRTNLEKK